MGIFVGNLAYTTTEPELRQLFEPYGTGTASISSRTARLGVRGALALLDAGRHRGAGRDRRARSDGARRTNVDDQEARPGKSGVAHGSRDGKYQEGRLWARLPMSHTRRAFGSCT